MSISEIFFRELWKLWPFIYPVTFGLSIGMLVRLASSHCFTFFTHTKSYPELAAFTKEDQEGLLREASREAFSGLSFVPMLVFLAFLWVGAALAGTLQKVTALPQWVEILLFMLFLLVGYWLGRRLEAHRVRPFLKKRIEGQNGKTVT